MAVRRFKEAIHSGHFMVSDFEADAEDEEDLVVPPPPSTLAAGKEGTDVVVAVVASEDDTANPEAVVACKCNDSYDSDTDIPIDQDQQSRDETKLESSAGAVSSSKDRWSPDGSHLLDVSLHKLFQSMSIAYRHKLTSPKWNRFRGLKLRWKDKIRLNNVIWRCWHLQFMKDRHVGLLCAFANPLEIDNHNRTEGSTLLEGKYWKRRLQTITKEYMRWRMFYKTRAGCSPDDDDLTTDKLLDQLFRTPTGNLNSKDDIMLHTDVEDADLLALFNLEMPDYVLDNFGLDHKSNQPTLPSQRQNMRSSTNADFIQPGLVQLQPNLEDLFGDMDNNEWLPLPTMGPHPQGKGKGAAVNGKMAGKASSKLTTQTSNTVSNATRAPGRGKPDVFTYREKQKDALDHAMADVTMAEDKPNLPTSNMATSSMAASTMGSSLRGNSFPPSFVMAESKVEPMEAQSLDLSMSYSTATSTVVSMEAQAAHNRVVACVTNSGYKSHSPKHRILYHRNQDYFVASSNNLASARHAPYTLPNYAKTKNEMTNLASGRQLPPSLIHVLRDKSGCGEPMATSIPPPSESSQPRIMSETAMSPVEPVADQRRRGQSIQSGFDTLRSLLPALRNDSTTKISKAALLHKAGDHLREMKNESEMVSSQINSLRVQISRQRAELEALQEALPTADGRRMRGRRPESQEVPELTRCFDDHVRNCTLQNWKYWVFASLFRPLFHSYVSSVSTDSFDDLVRSTITWMDQECDWLPLRRSFGNSLTQLAINTDVLAHPERIPHEAVRAVTSQSEVKREDERMSAHSNHASLI